MQSGNAVARAASAIGKSVTAQIYSMFIILETFGIMHSHRV